MPKFRPNPPIETLKRLPKFLELLKEWPPRLEARFGALRGLEWDAWWDAAKHHFVNDLEPIPVQVVSSESDFRCLRDAEAEEDGDQVTVVLNLWYSKKVILEAIDDLLDEKRVHWPTGDAHEDWICEDLVIKAYRQTQALDKIYEVMRYALKEKLGTREIADKMNCDERDIRRMRIKGTHLLERLKECVFPETEPRGVE